MSRSSCTKPVCTKTKWKHAFRKISASSDLPMPSTNLHPNAVAQNGPRREKASGVHRQNPDRLSALPILSGHAIDEAAFSASSRAGHSYNMRSSRMRVDGPENGLDVRVSVVD